MFNLNANTGLLTVCHTPTGLYEWLPPTIRAQQRSDLSRSAVVRTQHHNVRRAELLMGNMMMKEQSCCELCIATVTNSVLQPAVVLLPGSSSATPDPSTFASTHAATLPQHDCNGSVFLQIVLPASGSRFGNCSGTSLRCVHFTLSTPISSPEPPALRTITSWLLLSILWLPRHW